MKNILELNSVTKHYKGFTLDNVSFTIPAGFIAGMIGPNGAGKTTIIKLMMNLIGKDGGEIKVFGKDNIEYEEEIKSQIGFVYDEPNFYEDLKLSDLKNATALFYKEWSDTKFAELVDKFELPLKKRFKKLSHGFKMKFWLAIALSHNADLIILDEPTSGLDPVFRRELLDHLSGIIQDENKSVLFSTHITTDLERIADYIIFIMNGKIVFSTTKDEILENWGVVKAGSEILNEVNRELFKGIKTSNFGIEALTDDINEAQKRFNSSC
ncbi:MAG: ABC transporter ATP-binding protein, partial [Ignavibacteriaceae bacterium]